MTFYRPENYVDPNAQVASGVTPPPLPRKIGFVTQSPGDLFLASKGITSQTKALITHLTSATEIKTSRNEVVTIRDQNTGQAMVAIDVGSSVDPTVRELLVLPTEPATVEDPVVVSEPDDYGSEPVGPSAEYLQAQVLNQHSQVTNERQVTVENATPSGPSQYYAPAGSYTVAATSYTTPSQPTYSAPAPTTTNTQWVSAGAFITSDYEAYLLGTA